MPSAPATDLRRGRRGIRGGRGRRAAGRVSPASAPCSIASWPPSGPGSGIAASRRRASAPASRRDAAPPAAGPPTRRRSSACRPGAAGACRRRPLARRGRPARRSRSRSDSARGSSRARDQFRPPPPPAPGSADFAAGLAAVRAATGASDARRDPRHLGLGPERGDALERDRRRGDPPPPSVRARGRARAHVSQHGAVGRDDRLLGREAHLLVSPALRRWTRRSTSRSRCPISRPIPPRTRRCSRPARPCSATSIPDEQAALDSLAPRRRRRGSGPACTTRSTTRPGRGWADGWRRRRTAVLDAEGAGSRAASR